jgi:hypothetical protein
MARVGRPRLYTGCKEDGCDKPHSARGLCNTHYHKLRYNNEIADIHPKVSGTAAERIQANSFTDKGHTIWTGSFRGPDIPQVAASTSGGRTNLRVALWEEVTGETVPDGWTIRSRHNCPTGCVEIDHLQLVTIHKRAC